MALSQSLTIDIARRGTIHIPAKQADHGYDIIITVLENGVNIVDHTTDTASYRVQKPDGNAVYDSCTVNNDDTITFHVDDAGQILAVAGFVSVDISIEENGDVKSTQNFVLDVQAAPGGSAIPSSTEFTQLQALVTSTQQLNEDAEAYAIGERGGVPVASGDPAYENNAKYYNTQAQSAATTLSGAVDDVDDLKSALTAFVGWNSSDYITWEQGGYGAIKNFESPSINESTTRIHAQITVPAGKYVILYTNPNYMFTWATFDSTGTFLEGEAGWQNSMKYMGYDATYVRLAIKRSDDADILPAEGITSQIAVVSYQTNPVKLKVMTYNIGRYSFGVSPYYLDTDYDTKVANLKEFYMSENCDIIGLQEANTYLDGATSGSITANATLYDYLYPFYTDFAENTSLKSKYPMKNKGNGTLSTGRPKSYGTIVLEGKDIYLLCVHLTPNAGDSQETLRATERAEIIAEMAGHQYAICFGDFNAQQFSDFADFTNAGLKIANGGYADEVNTYGGLTVFSERLPMDNIVVTPNIIIDSAERLMVFSDLVSDHIPFVASLTIN